MSSSLTPTPLDRLLAQAVRKVKDPMVRRWFRALLKSGERASSAEGIGGDGAESTSERQESGE
jgi:hypothetical protein